MADHTPPIQPLTAIQTLAGPEQSESAGRSGSALNPEQVNPPRPEMVNTLRQKVRRTSRRRARSQKFFKAMRAKIVPTELVPAGTSHSNAHQNLFSDVHVNTQEEKVLPSCNGSNTEFQDTTNAEVVNDEHTNYVSLFAYSPVPATTVEEINQAQSQCEIDDLLISDTTHHGSEDLFPTPNIEVVNADVLAATQYQYKFSEPVDTSLNTQREKEVSSNELDLIREFQDTTNAEVVNDEHTNYVSLFAYSPVPATTVEEINQAQSQCEIDDLLISDTTHHGSEDLFPTPNIEVVNADVLAATQYQYKFSEPVDTSLNTQREKEVSSNELDLIREFQDSTNAEAFNAVPTNDQSLHVVSPLPGTTAEEMNDAQSQHEIDDLLMSDTTHHAREDLFPTQNIEDVNADYVHLSREERMDIIDCLVAFIDDIEKEFEE